MPRSVPRGALGPPGEWIMSDTASAAPMLRYAGFWRRLAAFAIDHLIVIAVFAIAVFGIGVAYVLLSGDMDRAVTTYLEIAYFAVKPLSVVVLWLYYAIMECGARQATFGKRALAIKVTNLAGEPIGFWRSFGRQAGKIVSTITLGIGFVIAAFTTSSRAAW
jgi:uncharacterized RDD family membrane protein YckC